MYTRGSAHPKGMKPSEQSTSGWEKRKEESGASVKTGRRSSIAQKKVHSFGVKGAMVEVIRLSSKNIMKKSSYNSVPLKYMSAI